MGNFKPDKMMIVGMTDADKAVLLSIYTHRCLSKHLMSKFIYEPAGIPEIIASHKIDALELDGLLEYVPYCESGAYFLTTLGVRTVIELYGNEYLSSIYKPGKKKVELPSYASLKMYEKNINHQMNLNQFDLEFESYASGVIPFQYYDQNFMPPASNFMMPDGMLELPDRLLFLEMDMGHENAKQLSKKWNSYRLFLNDPAPYYRGKPITMFFLIEGVRRPNLRQRSAMKTLMVHLGDRVKGNFEAFFEDMKTSHEIIQSRYLHSNIKINLSDMDILKKIEQAHGFKIAKPQFLEEIFMSDCFYIRKIDSETGKIIKIQGRPQEFILDIWMDSRFSALRNIANYSLTRETMRRIAGRGIPYVLVVPSISWANNTLKILDFSMPDEIFFTTPERLQTLSWNEALFRIDQIKNLLHFSDDSLSEEVHERRLTKY